MSAETIVALSSPATLENGSCRDSLPGALWQIHERQIHGLFVVPVLDRVPLEDIVRGGTEVIHERLKGCLQVSLGALETVPSDNEEGIGK
jgi:hypothetical protein